MAPKKGTDGEKGPPAWMGPPIVPRPPRPMLAPAVLRRAVRGRAGKALPRSGQLSKLSGEKKIISLPYFFPVRRPSVSCELRDLKGLSPGAASPGLGAEGRFGVAGSVPWS